MTAKIKEQKNLMQRAIDVLWSIDMNEKLFRDIDAPFWKQKQDELKDEYALLMSQLMITIMEQANVKLSVPEPSNVVELAEQFAA